VLETTFECKEGAFRLIDFMPVRGKYSDVVRIVEGIRGTFPVHMELAIRFDYGRTVPWVTSDESGTRAVGGPSLVMLRGSVETHGEGLSTVADFVIEPGERQWFTLTYGKSHLPEPEPIDALKAHQETVDFWTEWTSRNPRRGKYAEAVERSLITLKALTYRPTGGVVAAPTTSLPEEIGGVRNWDYRYCWLRDTTFTLLALMSGGYYEEAQEWQDWLLRALAGSPDQVQIMYGIAGERSLVEWKVEWLKGYENSKPVRVGNAASTQLQLDIYGEVMDSFYHAELGLDKFRKEDFEIWKKLIEHLSTVWMKPDKGIWETRGKPQHFTYSKVMAWVAFDRAIDMAEHRGLDVPLEEWKQTREAIHKEVCEKAWNKRMKSFVQSYERPILDSSLLLIPLMGFLPADDPRVLATIKAVTKHLMRDGFMLRYNPKKFDDGLPGGEGAFIACSFWLVSALQAAGKKREATKLFEKLLKIRNDVGLLSEEYDTKRDRQVGNFPQAFSHIAMVVAALHLEEDGMAAHKHAYNMSEGRKSLSHRKAIRSKYRAQAAQKTAKQK
jgi:GH15 family glucan-1,4-alpha-glucosidase